MEYYYTHYTTYCSCNSQGGTTVHILDSDRARPSDGALYMYIIDRFDTSFVLSPCVKIKGDDEAEKGFYSRTHTSVLVEH